MATTAQSVGGAIDRNGTWLLIAVLVLLAAATAVLADRKPLWNDELFTYYISRLPGVGDMWSTLGTGVEQTPITLLRRHASVASTSSATARSRCACRRCSAIC